MRIAIILGVAFLGAAGAAGAAGAQELEIEDAAARLVVIPEARRDIQVTVTPGSARLPALEVRRTRSGVEVDGDLRRRIDGCETRNGQQSVRIDGVGLVPVSQLPLITARVPLDAEIGAAGAVWGSIGRTNSLELSSAGCGDIRAANVAGKAEVSLAGSGDVLVGSSSQASVSLAGSGDVRLGGVTGSLSASTAGSGDIRVASVGGAVEASIAGSGDVWIEGGRTGPVRASIAGSGDVRIAGAATSLEASIVGSGDVRVSQVSGPVRRSIMGSGEVLVGR